jgi:hypothetical protein
MCACPFSKTMGMEMAFTAVLKDNVLPRLIFDQFH